MRPAWPHSAQRAKARAAGMVPPNAAEGFGRCPPRDMEAPTFASGGPRSMRRLAWALVALAVLCAFRGLSLLADPFPASSDLAAFSLVSAGLALGVAGLAFLRRRAWHVWFFAAWAGCSIAALALAYKDTFVTELHVFGPWKLAGHMLAHAWIAPITVFFGFLVGFVEPDAWMYVLACVAVALLAGELLRRRLWPRASASRDPVVSGGSAAGR